MHPAYKLIDEASVFTPALVFYPALIRENIAAIIAMVGGTERLRPHVKTHKTAEIAKMQLEAGVTKHKCATIAEAELLASVGVPDVLISYPLVGPNIGRLLTLISRFPGTAFSTIIDHPAQLTLLSEALSLIRKTIDVLVDLNVGMNRTGIAVGDEAMSLYAKMANSPGVRPGGFHVYDGHNSTEPRADRDASARATLSRVLPMRSALQERGIAVPRLVCGGTPSFPSYAAIRDVDDLECSPGTYVLHDVGYGRYPDLATVTPAAICLTRVVSRPAPNRVTLDLGNKSVAADPLMVKRVKLLDFPEHTIVMHSEEHLVVETTVPVDYLPGDLVYAIPGHICPTVALHREVLIAEGGQIVARWKVAARDRFLSV